MSPLEPVPNDVRSRGTVERTHRPQSRLQKSAADYAVIAICPALIVVMITALTHFLVLCFYQGDYPGRLMYILFLFIVGATGIARISIEQGRSYALGYAAALGAATFIAINRFVSFSGPLAGLSLFFNTGIIVLIWWLADRVTFDCTVIDDAQNASGEGLVDSRGLFGGFGSLGARKKDAQASPDTTLDGTSGTTHDEADSRAIPKKRRGHQPGRWVLYLAVAALPLFGIGQLFLPNFDTIRTGALRSLALYLFATLTLLVTTSFLGLRRYLRQRGTEMPTQVSVAWLAGGAGLVAALLFLAFILPLPGRMLASLEAPKWMTSPDNLKSSQYGWGNEGAGQPQSNQPAASQGHAGEQSDNGSEGSPNNQSGGEQGKPQGTGESSPKQPSSTGNQQSSSSQSSSSGPKSPGNQQSSGDQPSSGGDKQDSQGKNSDSQNSSSKGSQGEQKSSEGQQNSTDKQDASDKQNSNNDPESPTGEQGSGDKQDSNNKPKNKPENKSNSQSEKQEPSSDRSQGSDPATSKPQSSPNQPSQSGGSWLPKIGSFLTTIIKLVIGLVLLGVIAFFAYKNWDAIVAWWNNLLSRLRGEAPVTEEAMQTEHQAPAKLRRPFASFSNPLATNVPPDQAVITSFQAFDAWGREQGLPRGDEETPSEYVHRIRGQLGDGARLANGLAEAYNRIVYGAAKATKSDLGCVKEIWAFMDRKRPSATT